eukprot:4658403-Amphidinium_carterae.2
MDYTFATEGPVTMTILTMRSRSTGWSAATPVPGKGACAYAVDWAISVLHSVGSQPCRILHQSTCQWSVVRQAPRSSHQSVGAVERYHGELHGHIWAMKTKLKQKFRKKVELQSPLSVHMAWQACLLAYSSL